MIISNVIVTQNASIQKKRPGVRPYVPPEMAGGGGQGNFRLMMHQTTVQDLLYKLQQCQSLNIIYLYTILFTHSTFYIIQIHYIDLGRDKLAIFTFTIYVNIIVYMYLYIDAHVQVFSAI